MKNKIKQKLRSQTGASITFALLIFLVCTVIGAAVLTAGTVAAGRMSNVTEMDQRYYSVSSAARLVRELLQKDTIWVEDNKLYIGDVEIVDSVTSLAIDAARTARDMEKKSPQATKETKELVLTVSRTAAYEELTVSGTAAYEELTVSIREIIYPGGDLTITVGNTDDTNRYTITMYFMNVGGTSSYQWELYDIERAG